MEYIFSGKKAAFIELVQAKCNDFNNENKDSIQAFLKNDQISIGLVRTGHSSGFWFIANILEVEDHCFITGKISHIEEHKESLRSKILFWVFLWPIILACRLLFLPITLIVDRNSLFKRKKLNKFLCEYVGCKKVK